MKKKTKGQVEFETAQKRLKERIKSAEKAGYEFKADIKRLANISYYELTPQKAAQVKKEIGKLKGEMLRRGSNIKSYTTESGLKLSPSEFRKFKYGGYKQKAASVTDETYGSVAREYEKQAREIGFTQAAEAKKRDAFYRRAGGKKYARETYSEQYNYYEEIRQANRKRQELYWGVSNLFQGAQHSLMAGHYGANQMKFAHVFQFMKYMNVNDLGDVIKWMHKEGLNILVEIYSSNDFDLDSERDKVLAQDLDDLINKLKQYGYVPLSDEEAHVLSAIQERQYTNKHNKIKAYNASVLKSMAEEMI